ncbi:transcription antitermination factor NusB [Ruminococcus gauvreauii]|uniref:transcription antitermination factor NusB n=1 Tax=Ruminococcus gauvreauii TaxID=438033 RepID=UPI00398460DD
MGRRELRENIFKLLFLSAFNQEDEMPRQLELYFDNLEDLQEKDQIYMEDKFRLIMGKLGEIDGLLNDKSSGWKTTRMSKVDLTILRLAVYEIRFDEDVPTGVAINEAVELAKRFGQDESASFVNGILGAVAQE